MQLVMLMQLAVPMHLAVFNSKKAILCVTLLHRQNIKQTASQLYTAADYQLTGPSTQQMQSRHALYLSDCA